MRGRDRHRVDVSLALATAASAEAATPPPGEGRERAAPRLPGGRRLDCDQRAKASAERRDPALRLRGAAARRAPPLPRSGHKPEQRGDDASQARFAGVREPTILLTAGAVHAAPASSWRPQPDALSLALSCAIARSCHRRQTARTRSTIGPIRPVLCGPGRRIFLQTCPQSPFSLPQVPICRDKGSTATGIRSQPLRGDIGRFFLQIVWFVVLGEPL
jgi:hypothetical protein